jgi:RHS repeat-associated protein
VLQRHYYYPFGMQMEGLWNGQTAPGMRYLYNGKELEEDLGLNWYAYGFRYYDAAIGRFTGVDPIADQFPWVTTFNYAENDPVSGIDLWGLQYVNTNTGESRGPIDPLNSKEGVSEEYDVNRNGTQDHYLPVVEVRAARTIQSDTSIPSGGDPSFENTSIDTRNNTGLLGKVATMGSFSSAASTGYGDFFVSGNRYKGVSGNYYTYAGRQGWNQYTGTKQHMNSALAKADWATRTTYGFGIMNYGITTYVWSEGELSNTSFGIEMISISIGTFAPAPISIPWTVGYEGLGRNGIARLNWYQDRFKPWARRHMGVR